MHDIQITWITPIHDQVLLVVFEDRTVNTYDVKLIRNRHEVFMPSKNPALREPAFQVPAEYGPILEAAVGQSEYQPCPDGVEVTLDLGEDLLERSLRWCDARRVTLEQVVHALCRFIADEANADAVHQWLTDSMREDAAATAVLDACMRQYTEDELQADFDRILDLLKEESPIVIMRDGRPSVLMYDWADYWRRFGSCYPPGERERIEAECRKGGDGA